MQLDFTDNFFALFELPKQFEIDTAQLDARYRSLQKHLHPDRFAAAAAAEKRWSMQAASFVNEAYQTLGKPLPRAAYLLSLNGISVDEETDTSMSPAFLMQQMELREQLADAAGASDPYAALDAVRKQLKSGSQASQQAFAAAAEKQDWTAARLAVREWQFLDKLGKEVQAQEARLDDAL